MKKQKFRNKKYKPKPVVSLPPLFRHNSEADFVLQLVPHQELEAIRQGDGTENNWNGLAARLNLGSILSIMYFKENQQLMKDALDAIRSLKARAENTGRWVMTGDELRIVGEALNRTDDMQLNTRRKDLNIAMNIVLEEAAIYK